MAKVSIASLLLAECYQNALQILFDVIDSPLCAKSRWSSSILFHSMVSTDAISRGFQTVLEPEVLQNQFESKWSVSSFTCCVWRWLSTRSSTTHT